jgi:hypothetical protein
MSTILKLVGAFVLVVLALAVAWVQIFMGIGRPVLWEVPEGFRGWASLEHERPECPPLRTRGVFLVLSTLPDGHGCTSSPAPVPAARYRRLEYVSSDGSRLKGEISKGRFYDASRRQWFLFVGSEAELREQPGPKWPVRTE